MLLDSLLEFLFRNLFFPHTQPHTESRTSPDSAPPPVNVSTKWGEWVGVFALSKVARWRWSRRFSEVDVESVANFDIVAPQHQQGMMRCEWCCAGRRGTLSEVAERSASEDNHRVFNQLPDIKYLLQLQWFALDGSFNVLKGFNP